MWEMRWWDGSELPASILPPLLTDGQPAAHHNLSGRGVWRLLCGPGVGCPAEGGRPHHSVQTRVDSTTLPVPAEAPIHGVCERCDGKCNIRWKEDDAHVLRRNCGEADLSADLSGHVKRCWTIFPGQLANFIIIKAAAAARTTANSFLFNKLEATIFPPLALSHIAWKDCSTD